MCSLELTAHLLIHGKEYTYCKEPGCDNKNEDPWNVHVHARRHSDMLSFKCPKCGKGLMCSKEMAFRYRSGMVNLSTVNLKFHLIQSVFKILARTVSLHV